VTAPVAARLLRPAALAVAAVVCAFGLAVVVRAVLADAIDLQVYRAGGQAVLAGAPLYDGPVWSGLAFTYTPFAALLFTPLAALPPIAATAAVVGLNSLLLLGCAYGCWRTAAPGLRRPQLALLAAATSGVLLATEAVHTTVYLGQVNLLLLALVLWDLLGRDGRRTVGIGIGIAAGIKLTPFALVLLLLATRRFRAAATAVAAFTATVVLGLLVLPTQALPYWLHGTFADSGRVYQDVASPHNQSLRGMVLRATTSPQVATVVWLTAALGVAVITFVIAAWAHRRGERLLAAALAGLGAPALSPWSWGHHWVWLLPLAVFLGGLLVRSGSARPGPEWLAPALLLPLTFPWVLALADPPDSAATPVLSGPSAFLIGNLYVVIFAVALAAAVVHVRRTAPPAVVAASPALRDAVPA
jgi:alpha-1,2-mannosyltransferase